MNPYEMTQLQARNTLYAMEDMLRREKESNAALRARVAELEAALYEARDDVAETLNTVTGWGGKRHRIDAVTRQLAHIDKLLEGYKR